jgi:hypothetical protein
MLSTFLRATAVATLLVTLPLDAVADPLKLIGSWQVTETIAADTCDGKGGKPGDINAYTWTVAWRDGKYMVAVSAGETMFKKFSFDPPPSSTPDPKPLMVSARVTRDKAPFGTTAGDAPRAIVRAASSTWNLRLEDGVLRGERLYGYGIEEAGPAGEEVPTTQMLACANLRTIEATRTGAAPASAMPF